MTAPVKHLLVSAALAALLAAPGCTASGRLVNDPDRHDLAVGQDGADIPTWELLIREALETLIARTVQHQEKLVAFVGIENASDEDLGLEVEAASDTIDTILVNSGLYRMVSRRLIDEAMREVGLSSPDALVLPRYRKDFVDVLADPARAPEYLLWARFTSQTTGMAQARERKYLLTLDLINAHTGITEAKVQSEVIKELVG